MSPSASPPSKRLKLESPSPSPPPKSKQDPEDLDQDLCSICLQKIIDRTVIPICAHEFCFECLIIWSEQSRRCPLCSQTIGEYLIHYIRSKYDYKKHYLTPLRKSPALQQAQARAAARANVRRRTEREWGRRHRREREEADELDRAIAKRRWIYEHNLYAKKHVASNSYTRYRPYPTPSQFSASPELIARTTTFLRRELRVWMNLDVEFLTTFILSLMKSIDIRSESAVKLLAEFLDMDDEGRGVYVEGERSVNAEHFAHEVYSYLRSPYRDLFVYDSVVQYDTPPNAPLPTEYERSRRWRPRSASRSRSRSRVPSRSRSRSRSPPSRNSGRRYNVSRSRSLPRSRTEERIAGGSNHRRLSHSRSRTRSRERDNRPRGGLHQARGHVSSADDKAMPSDHHDAHNEDVSKPDQDPKGKVRATTPLHDRKSQDDDNGDALVTNTMDADTAPSSSSSTVAPRQPPTRPPRNRNRTLLESVQSHLNGRSKTQNRTQVITSPPNVKPSNPSHPVSRTATTPSLLERLSDPSGALALVANQIEGGSSEFSATNPINPSKADQIKTSLSMSAPEIMARTRARLAELKSASTSGDMDTNVIESPSVSDSVPSPSSGVGSLSSNMRMKLLTRLEEERQRVPGSTNIASSSSSSSGKELISTSPTLGLIDTDFHATERENKLRMRAQLRVRLAAAKRGSS